MIYPLIELATAGLFLLYFMQAGFTTLNLREFLFSVICITIIAIDWEYFIIPNKILAVGIVGLILLEGIFEKDELLNSIAEGFGCFIFLFSIRFIGNLYFKKETMGFGDVKLAAFLGLMIGFGGFLVVLWVSSIAGILFNMFISQEQTSKKIPLGSFLCSFSILHLLLSGYRIDISRLWMD